MSMFIEGSEVTWTLQQIEQKTGRRLRICIDLDSTGTVEDEFNRVVVRWKDPYDLLEKLDKILNNPDMFR